MHWKLMKKTLKYLKGTINYSLCYDEDDMQKKGYTDATLHEIVCQLVVITFSIYSVTSTRKLSA